MIAALSAHKEIAMDVFKGLLGSHKCYLAHVALDNCLDYFNLLEAQKKEGRDKITDRYIRLRYFLNAIESLNNIPEYFFHEHKGSQGWNDAQLRNVLGQIRSKHAVLKDIEQIANAYKHCVRRNSDDMHAGDMQSPLLEISIGSHGVKVKYMFESIEDEEIMGEAFRFWHGYHQSTDKSVLIP